MRDSVAQLVDLLRQLAEVLQPFVTSHRAGDRVWNGHEYAPATESRDADPVAAAWYASATTAAALLESQHALTPEQHEVLRHQLFGGMGSLQDFSLERERWGRRATEANRQLEIIQPALYSCLQSLTPRAPQKT